MRKMIFDEVSGRAFVLEHKSRNIYAFPVSSKRSLEQFREKFIWFEATSEILHLSSTYVNNDKEDMKLILVEGGSNYMKILKRSERQLVVEKEVYVASELEKEISEEMFFAYDLLYQGDRYFYVQSKNQE